MSDYRPVSCAQHSEYELMVIHRQRVAVQLIAATRLTGVVVDMVSRSGAEYMVLQLDSGDREEMRLDRLESVCAIQ